MGNHLLLCISLMAIVNLVITDNLVVCCIILLYNLENNTFTEGESQWT